MSWVFQLTSREDSVCTSTARSISQLHTRLPPGTTTRTKQKLEALGSSEPLSSSSPVAEIHTQVGGRRAPG